MPETGEEFVSLEACNYRLRAFALAEGFDIVRNGRGTAAAPSYRFRCFCHCIRVRQLNCLWQALCSIKSVGKRGSGIKAYILTVQNSEHRCTLTDGPLCIFPAHLKVTEEWQAFRYIAKKHREQGLIGSLGHSPT